MARRFKQPEEIAVQGTAQNLSLQTDGSQGLTEIASTVAGAIDKHNVDEFRQDIMEGVDDFEVAANTFKAADPNKPMTDDELEEMFADRNLDIDSLGTEAKAITRAYASLNRAAAQGKFDANQLAIRIESVTRQAIRRRPSLAREFAQVASLYGGSTMVQEMEALNKMREKSTSANQEQIEKFVEDAVDAGVNRALFLTNPPEFFKQAVTRVDRANAHDRAMETFAKNAAMHNDGAPGAKAAVSGYVARTATQAGQIFNKYRDSFSSLEDMKEEIRSGGAVWKEMKSEVALRKAEFVNNALSNTAYTKYYTPEQITNWVDSSFAVVDQLLSGNAPDELFQQVEQSQDMFDLLALESLPQNQEDTIRLIRYMGPAAQYMSLGENAMVRQTIGNAVSTMASGANTDPNNPQAMRRQENQETSAAMSTIEHYSQNMSDEEKRVFERAEVARFRAGIAQYNDTASEADKIKSGRMVFANLRMFHKLVDQANQQGVALPRRFVEPMIEEMADPDFLKALLANKSDMVTAGLAQSDSLLSVAQSYGLEIRKQADKFGIGDNNGQVKLVYFPESNEYRYGYDASNLIEGLNNNRNSRKLLNNLSSLTRARAHMQGDFDYFAAAREVGAVGIPIVYSGSN